MTNEQLVQQIEKLEKNLNNPSLPDSAKAKMKDKIAELKSQVQEAAKEVEEKVEKLEKEEQKVQDDVEAQIAKLEKNLSNPNLPESVKETMRKKIAAAKEKLAEQKAEIKEDKKEAAEEKKELKQAVKEVEKVEKQVEKAVEKAEKEDKPVKVVRKTPIKKPKIKDKEREEKSKERKKEMKKILSDLSALIEKNKKLRKKYEGKGGDLERDASRSAKPFGYRFKGKHDYRVPTEAQIKRGLKRGTIDYEGRPNRSDVYPKGYKGKIKLAKGGMSDGSPNYEGANRKFNDNNLNREWAMLLQQDDLRISKSKDANADPDRPYILDINDKSYFYDSKSDRDFDFETMWDLVKYSKKAKGGDVQGKVTDKAKDGQRLAKPSGWRWKDEAEKIIGKKKMMRPPSKFMRRKYRDLVYKEQRPDKSDKKPSKKYISL